MRREGEGFSLLTNLARKAGAAVKRESAGADARAKRLNFERRAHTSPGRLAERDARCLPRGSFLKTYATTGAYPWGFRPLS